MRFDWRAFRELHPRFFVLAVVLKKLRTKVGIVFAAVCIAWAVYRPYQPLDLTILSWKLVAGAVLILVGLSFRLAALGCLRKKEELATAGVYSLCRHPLYLGSILITYGFCFLLNEPLNFVMATLYFVILYPFTILWEEIRLSERYGQAHEHFARTTPAILPLGRFRPCEFRFSQALKKGGAIQLSVTLLAVIAVAVLAEYVRRR